MIVECSTCHSRYKIDENKITGGEAKFKCRKCNNIVDAHRAVATEVADIVSTDKKSRKKRIVVADDTEFFRMMLTDILAENGYEVITACDGEDALIKIKHEMPDVDLVLLDMYMPKVDGFKVIEELKKGVMGKDLPILALSGVFKSEEARVHMRELGIVGYIDKDTSTERILERVNMILRPEN